DWSLNKEAIRDLRQLQRPDALTISAIIDLSLGLKQLFLKNSTYAANVVNRYAYGIKPEDGKGRMDLTRSVDALTREMNSVSRRRKAEYTEGPGTREVVSNAKAHVMTSQ